MLIKNSISAKLLLAFMVVGSIPVFLISIFSIQSANTLIHNEINSGIIRYVEAKEGQVFAYLYSIELIATDFVTDNFIKENTENIIAGDGDNYSMALINYLIDNKKVLDKSIIGISIFNLNGDTVIATDAIEIGKKETDHEYFAKSLELNQGEIIIRSEETAHSHFGSNDSLIVLIPLYNDNKKLGIISIFFNTDILDSVLSGSYQIEKGAVSGRAGLSDSLEVYLVNDQKKMFIHSGFSDRMDNMGVSKVDDNHYIGMMVDTKPVNNCLNEGSENSGIYDNYNGEEVIGASMCITKLGWVLVAEIPKSNAFASSMNFYYQIVLILFSLFFFILGLSLILTAKIVDPLKILTKSVNNIEKGNLDTIISINSKDEFGDLANSFNKMAKSLKKSKNTLAKKVDERTKDLEKINKYMVDRELKMIELKKELQAIKNKK